MSEIQVKAGKNIFEKGAPLTTLCVIVEGTATFELPLGTITLGPGDAIGLLDLESRTHSYTYTAVTDVVVDFQPFQQLDQFCQSFKNIPDMAKDFCLGTVSHVSLVNEAYNLVRYECDSVYTSLKQYYAEYTRLCGLYEIKPVALPALDELQPLPSENKFDAYIGQYYKDLNQIFSDASLSGIYDKSGFIGGFLVRACKDMHLIIQAYPELSAYLSNISRLLINAEKQDFLQLYSSLLASNKMKTTEIIALTSTVSRLFFLLDNTVPVDTELYQRRRLEYQELLQNLLRKSASAGSAADKQAKLTAEDLKDSLSKILDYADVDSDFRTAFVKQITEYKNEPDKSGDSDTIRALRRSLAKDFLTLYTQAFFHSMETDSLPAVLKLFFYFGYVDEQLCGIDNALELYERSAIVSDGSETNCFLLYDWLKLIYEGKREPHKDEFDRHYPAYVQSLEKDGSVTKEQAKQLLQDTKEKVRFEMNNMVASGLKITSGSPTTYCPILSAHSFIKPPAGALLTGSEISLALADILAVDYSAFHREVMFSDTTLGTQHEFIQKQVLPDFIILPGSGMRGSLWQEIEGADRQTPACMLLPAFCMTDLNLILLRLTGEFRWEMCKRAQGARWNDVTYPSLTSEYSDYLQFYKKNNDLSPDTKQKIKQQLARVRNRFKEYFLVDYMAWILFEAKGSPRLNKISRKILASYCPFPRKIRQDLIKNPLYTKLIEISENHKRKELGRIQTIISRIQRNNKDYCPDALLKQAEFLEL